MIKSFLDEELVDEAIERAYESTASSLTKLQTAHYITEVIKGLPGEAMKVVAVVGGPASGKSQLVQAVLADMAAGGLAADSISTDDYSVDTREWRWQREIEGADPQTELHDFDLLNSYVAAIKGIKGDAERIAVPTYDFKTGLAIAAGQQSYTHRIGRCDILLVEGDFDPVEAPNLKIFVDTRAKDRLDLRIKRDLVERGEVDAERIAASFRLRHNRQFIPYTAPAINNADIAIRTTPGAEQQPWRYDIYKRKLS
jgi:uridine kinase